MENKETSSDAPICGICGQPITPEDPQISKESMDAVVHQRCVEAEMMYANAWG